jgi:transposase
MSTPAQNIAAVALAAKNARTAWALLVRKQVYQVSHIPYDLA